MNMESEVLNAQELAYLGLELTPSAGVYAITGAITPMLVPILKINGVLYDCSTEPPAIIKLDFDAE